MNKPPRNISSLSYLALFSSQVSSLLFLYFIINRIKKRQKNEEGKLITRDSKENESFPLSSVTARRLHVVLMILHLMIRHLVDKLEAAGFLMCWEAFKAAKSCSAWCASIIRWKAANGAEMSFGKLRGWSTGCHVIRAIRIHLTIFFEKLLKCFSILNTIIISAAWLSSLPSVARRIKIVVELRYLLRHHQISVRIIVEIILLKSLKCFLCTSFSCHIIKHSLLISISDSPWFTCCHLLLF